MFHAISVLLVWTSVAIAAPGTTVVNLEADLDGLDRWSAWRQLPQAEDEPGGIAVDTDPKWAKLGLKAGDVIRTENGQPVSSELMLTEGVLLLEIERAHRPMILRVVLHGDPAHQVKLTADEFTDLVAHTNKRPLSRTVIANGRPSGVRIIDDMLHIRARLFVGDIVRTIAGTPIVSDSQFTAAMQALRIGTTDIELDRDGRRVTVTVEREASVELASIRKRNDSAFDVPASVRDALKEDFMMFTRRVRVIPSVTNGKVHGVKLLEIEPGSLYDALGLRDDDTIVDVDGHSVDNFSDAIRTHTALEKADKITVHLVRRGKPFAIVYSVIAN
jgi:S1-C subfamily serine protease